MTDAPAANMSAALDGALHGRNYHVEAKADEPWGRSVRILRGYKNEGRASAIGFVACIDATTDGRGEWRVYLGHGIQHYGDLTREIAEHGAKLAPYDAQDAAVIAAMFPELPLARYAD